MHESWVERITQPIADQVEGKHGEHDGKPGVEHKMWSSEYLITFRAKHGAPFRCGGLCAKAEKGKRGGIQNSGSDAKGALHDQRG